MRDEELLAVVGDLLNRKTDRGNRHVDNQVDVVDVVPLAAMPAPTSGLIWWSADMAAIGLPKTLPPKSSAAICAAVAEPGPVALAAGPERNADPDRIAGCLRGSTAAASNQQGSEADRP
jgi:hypothetical protein